MSNKNDALVNWTDDFSKLLAQETFRLFVARAKNESEDTTDKLFLGHLEYMLQYFLSFHMDRRHYEHLPKEKQNAAVYARFKEVKGQIEGSIADAFTAVITRLDPNEFEYYCKIKPSLPPVGTIQ